MFTKQQLENILFLDIETVSQSPDFGGVDERMQGLWEKKCIGLRKGEDEEKEASELYRERAAIFSEFGKIVCISCGYIRFADEVPGMRLKSYFGHDEKQLLAEFAGMLNTFMARPERNLCAHNGKEFDLPYMGRRYLINGLPLPGILADLQFKKPWELRVLDTMTMWKFGEFRSFASLDLLTAVFNIPTPKDDIDGSEVGRVFWEENDVERIARYCEKDVLATAQVVLKFSGEQIIRSENVEAV